MPSLEDLGPKTLSEIAEATETMYQRRAYLPGRVLLAMVWQSANDFFAGDLGVVASGSTWKRAKNFLTAVGVLHNGGGLYQVA